MNLVRITLAALGATVALVASACGGSSSVPSGSVAVVGGTKISKDQLDQILGLVKKGLEAQKQEFPKVGTPEYQSLLTQYVAILVEREENRQAAEELGLEVTANDVDKVEEDFVKERFGGDEKEYEKALKEQGLTREDHRWILEGSVVALKLFEEVTRDTKVTGEDILAYYTQNQSQYGTPESRDVRHILIQTPRPGATPPGPGQAYTSDQIDFAKSKVEADRIYAELQGGADFAALAKDNSDDTGTKNAGGRLTIERGKTVPEFDKTAFELDKGEISKPVKTAYGYHVIEAISPIRPAKTRPLEQEKAAIRTMLLQQKRTEVISAWREDLRKKYDGKVSYAAGYEPPEIPEAPTETQ